MNITVTAVHVLLKSEPVRTRVFSYIYNILYIHVDVCVCGSVCDLMLKIIMTNYI